MWTSIDFESDAVRLVVDAMPVAIIVADDDGGILLVNAHAQRLFGYARNELIGRSIEQLVPERFHAAHLTLRSAFAFSPAERPMGVGRELYGLRKDGTEFPVDVGLNPVASDSTTRTFVTVSDATERKALEQHRLRSVIELQRRLNLENELEREHHLTRAMQSVFLSRAFPRVPGIAFDSLYRPPTDDGPIGGDWHDAFMLPNGMMALTIGDVTGHGLEAALVMMSVRETLRSIALSTEKSPAAVLEATNRIVATMPDIITTAIVSYYDASRGRLTLAAAGHPAPILVRNTVATVQDVHGILLGAAPNSAFTDVTIELLAGDVIAFYTDGLIEGVHRAIQGEARLLESLSTYRFDGLDALFDRMLIEGQPDDATLVLMCKQ